MRFHPAQTDPASLQRISELFRDRMAQRGVLPKNPWKAKKTEQWLARMGARMKPGSYRFNPYMGVVQCEKYVNFRVTCPTSRRRINGSRGGHFMRVEIPHELADKILALGYLP